MIGAGKTTLALFLPGVCLVSLIRNQLSYNSRSPYFLERLESTSITSKVSTGESQAIEYDDDDSPFSFAPRKEPFISNWEVFTDQLNSSDWDDFSSQLLFQDDQTQQERHLRFPSVEDRVKLYMSYWYIPPCSDNEDGHIIYQFDENNQHFILKQPAGSNEKHPAVVQINNDFRRASAFYIDQFALQKACLDRKKLRGYCRDINATIYPALQRVFGGALVNSPTLVQIGDKRVSAIERIELFGKKKKIYYPQVPLLMKSRPRMENSTWIQTIQPGKCFKTLRPEIKTISTGPREFPPIIWLLNSYRHFFGEIPLVPANDRPWSQKLNAAVFRGGLTGMSRSSVRKNGNSITDKCHMIPRCSLVLKTANSTKINAKLTGRTHFMDRQGINGIPIFGESMSQTELLEYKAIIMLEGNDIASGLKWTLYSNSVVIMQHPRMTSWLMEELLEPWVHYIPLKDDLSDVEEKMQWVLDHDQRAEQIARRGSLWVQDLLFHPDSRKENDQINDEILRRYHQHFKPAADGALAY